MDTTAKRTQAADEYLHARSGCYEWRSARYMAALRVLEAHGLDHTHTVVDVGAGWTEFDVELRMSGWRGRYWPIDACFDGTNLDDGWQPRRQAEFFVALEVIEHLRVPEIFTIGLQRNATRAVILSTPNPETTDVLGMDPTHKTPIHADWLRARGFVVVERSFYGNPADSLFAVWTPEAQ